jgi:hypothetical protein
MNLSRLNASSAPTPTVIVQKTGGFGLLLIGLTLVMFAANLFGFTSIPWWLVFLPIYIFPALCLGFVILLLAWVVLAFVVGVAASFFRKN